jgi:hypothetical protein
MYVLVSGYFLEIGCLIVPMRLRLVQATEGWRAGLWGNGGG